MRTEICCNTTWKINLRNGFLGVFLHSYTFHSAEHLSAADSVVLNLLHFQFGPVISRVLICQARPISSALSLQMQIGIQMRNNDWTTPRSSMSHMWTGKHIAATIHCVCVGCQIINMQNRGFCFI